MDCGAEAVWNANGWKQLWCVCCYGRLAMQDSPCIHVYPGIYLQYIQCVNVSLFQAAEAIIQGRSTAMLLEANCSGFRDKMFELISYEKFRDTKDVRFFDISVNESNYLDTGLSHVSAMVMLPFLNEDKELFSLLKLNG